MCKAGFVSQDCGGRLVAAARVERHAVELLLQPPSLVRHLLQLALEELLLVLQRGDQRMIRAGRRRMVAEPKQCADAACV